MRFRFACLMIFAVVLSLSLHFIQLNWVREFCQTPWTPVTPKSCSSLFERLYLWPLLLFLGLAAMAAWYSKAGSFRQWGQSVLKISNSIFLFSPKKNIGDKLQFIILTFLSLFMFEKKFGFERLNPKNTGWLSVGGDAVQAQMGSWLFRTEPWSFPLGKMNLIMAPEGTNVAFTDPVLLLAICSKIFKVYFLPEWQYIGIWLLFCYFLFAYCNLKFVQLWNLRFWQTTFISSILTLSPILLARYGHFTLNAFFILPFCFYQLVLLERGIECRELKLRPFIALSFMFILTAWLHPYLAFLVGIFFFSAFLVLMFNFSGERKINIAVFSGSVALVMLSWYIIGYIGSGIPASDSDFPRYFTANLNSFFNPLEYSAFVRSLPLGAGQYEGFGYLGLGILLCAVGIVHCISFSGIKAFVKRHPICALASLIGFVTSLGCAISFNKLRIDFLIPVYGHFLAPFRSTGRFIWIPSFFIVFAVLFMFVRRSSSRPRTTVLILFLILTLQFFEFKNTLLSKSFLGEGVLEKYRSQLPVWKSELAGIREIHAYPALGETVFELNDYSFFWYLAGETRARVNLGYVSRFNGAIVVQENARIEQILQTGFGADAKVLYVFSVNEKKIHPAPLFRCRQIENYQACKI